MTQFRFVWKLVLDFIFGKADIWLENICFAETFPQDYLLLHNPESCHLYF